MACLMRHRFLLSTSKHRTLVKSAALKFSRGKDDGPPPPCTEPPNPCLAPLEPPPCPPPPPPCGPPCPPPTCVVTPDPNNPCNYCPPENPDPDEPDMTNIKKLQCLFQTHDDRPIFLRKGSSDVYLFHGITIGVCLSFIYSLYSMYTLL